MILILLFSSLLAFGQAPTHWSFIQEVKDRHEFYTNHQNITQPKDAWQTLFSLAYLDSGLRKLKDCVFFKVPGQNAGTLKLKTIPASEKCDTYLLVPGDRELQDIKSLHFSVYDKALVLEFSFLDFRAQKWEASIQGKSKKVEPTMSMSSSEFKDSKIILLAPRRDIKVSVEEAFLKENSRCHDINEDCKEVSPSQCDHCPGGWYEVPNGCSIGPKFCGPHNCGGKDRPACRRGMTWQKKESDFDCRTDSSFAYCSQGLTVACEGRQAYCR